MNGYHLVLVQENRMQMLQSTKRSARNLPDVIVTQIAAMKEKKKNEMR